MITGQHKLPARHIEQRESEDAIQAIEAREAPGQNPLQNRLGIRMTAELDSGQVTTQVRVVVDLAVIGNRAGAVGRVHGLMAGSGKVDDRQSAMRQRDPVPADFPNEDPCVVWSPMPKEIAVVLCQRQVDGRNQPAHGGLPLANTWAKYDKRASTLDGQGTPAVLPS